MTDLELAWLAGLLEGEGSFLPGSPSAPHRPKISLQMTDEDVVRKAAKLMSSRNTIKPYTRDPNWKPVYIANVSGRKAAELMVRLRPLLCVRRQHQIDIALSTYVDKDRRVSQDTVIAIRSALASGKAQTEVAREFGLCRETVNRIANRRGKYGE